VSLLNTAEKLLAESAAKAGVEALGAALSGITNPAKKRAAFNEALERMRWDIEAQAELDEANKG
jgi:hypothetical protein